VQSARCKVLDCQLCSLQFAVCSLNYPFRQWQPLKPQNYGKASLSSDVAQNSL
jgi:hypothetical protein